MIYFNNIAHFQFIPLVYFIKYSHIHIIYMKIYYYNLMIVEKVFENFISEKNPFFKINIKTLHNLYNISLNNLSYLILKLFII